MKEIVEETLKKLTTSAEKAEEDYIGEDGLLYCGKCHMPKEAYFDQELAQRCRASYSITEKMQFILTCPGS